MEKIHEQQKATRKTSSKEGRVLLSWSWPLRCLLHKNSAWLLNVRDLVLCIGLAPRGALHACTTKIRHSDPLRYDRTCFIGYRILNLLIGRGFQLAASRPLFQTPLTGWQVGNSADISERKLNKYLYFLLGSNYARELECAGHHGFSEDGAIEDSSCRES